MDYSRKKKFKWELKVDTYKLCWTIKSEHLKFNIELRIKVSNLQPKNFRI